MNKNILLIIVLLVVACVGIIYLFKINNKISIIQTPAVTDTVSPTMPDVTATPSATFIMGVITLPMRVVDNFYHDYLTCIKNPPKSIPETAPIYCISHNAYGSELLVKSISASSSAAPGIDPVLCAKIIPQSIQAIGTDPIVNNKTTATVEESFDTGNPVKLKVGVAQEGSSWKVENITCQTL